jgi:hypothetical protein
MRLFLAMLGSFKDRSEEGKAGRYITYKGEPRRYGMVLTNKDKGDEKVLVKITFWFEKGGKFEYKRGMGKLGDSIDTMLLLDIDTILCLRRGTFKNGGGSELPYDFDTAVRFGDIKWRGEASTADIQRFRELLTEHPEVIDELVPRL